MKKDLIYAAEQMLLAIKARKISDLEEHEDDLELAIIQAKEKRTQVQLGQCNQELNDLGNQRVKVCQRIDTRKKEQEKIRGRSDK